MVESSDQNDRTRTYIVLTKGTMVSHYRIVEKIGISGRDFRPEGTLGGICRTTQNTGDTVDFESRTVIKDLNPP